MVYTSCVLSRLVLDSLTILIVPLSHLGGGHTLRRMCTYCRLHCHNTYIDVDPTMVRCERENRIDPRGSVDVDKDHEMKGQGSYWKRESKARNMEVGLVVL